MKVEVLKAYGPYCVGAVIPEMPGNVARSMIGRGMVKELKAEGEEPAAENTEQRSIAAPVDRMIRQNDRKRRAERAPLPTPTLALGRGNG